jgi:hypothetical protein
MSAESPSESSGEVTLDENKKIIRDFLLCRYVISQLGPEDPPEERTTLEARLSDIMDEMIALKASPSEEDIREFKEAFSTGSPIDVSSLEGPVDSTAVTVEGIALEGVAAQTQIQKEKGLRVIDSRTNGGITKKLVSSGGSLIVTVLDAKDGSFFQLPVTKETADDVFEHPYIHKDIRDKQIAAGEVPAYEGQGVELSGRFTPDGYIVRIVQKKEGEDPIVVVSNPLNGNMIEALIAPANLNFVFKHPFTEIDRSRLA